STCEVPKGEVVSLEDTVDYTVYTSAMCMECGTYYYHTYDCRQITAVRLFRENLNTDEIKTYPIRRKQRIFYEN
ncbi:linear amide C-N hydrolase, partial [Bacillus cereus]|uniref:linear amide C-N hydrolase n=1 Tax=Bacillus cereus TaxID=1396 RepID=UPI002ABF3072